MAPLRLFVAVDPSPPVRSATLYASRLTKEGASHEAIAEFPFTGA